MNTEQTSKNIFMYGVFSDNNVDGRVVIGRLSEDVIEIISLLKKNISHFIFCWLTKFYCLFVFTS